MNDASATSNNHPSRERKNVEVTLLLNEASKGSAEAAEVLCSFVYEELQRSAGRKLASELHAQTLQRTALANEVWFRLFESRQQTWPNRRYFWASVAEAMRRILVEHARRRSAQKQGGGLEHVELDESVSSSSVSPQEVIAVHEALDQLASEDPRTASVVKHRYFLGLNEDEVADAMGISKATVQRCWRFARAWLRTRL